MYDHALRMGESLHKPEKASATSHANWWQRQFPQAREPPGNSRFQVPASVRLRIETFRLHRLR